MHNNPDISGSGCPELIQWGAEDLLLITVVFFHSPPGVEA